MGTYTPNLNLYKPDASDPFGEFREKFNDNMDILDNGGGGGSGGHTIYDPNGNALAQENGLQFTGNVSVSDDSGNGRTVVDILGGGGDVMDVEVNGTSVVDPITKVAEITSYKEVTQAEYDALPASKLSDDIAYFIKDSGGGVDFLEVVNGAVNIIFEE